MMDSLAFVLHLHCDLASSFTDMPYRQLQTRVDNLVKAASVIKPVEAESNLLYRCDNACPSPLLQLLVLQC